jgi:hypothetical protein
MFCVVIRFARGTQILKHSNTKNGQLDYQAKHVLSKVKGRQKRK